MNHHLIPESAQQEIAAQIDRAVQEVLSELPNHGSEEGLTPVLGHALKRQSFQSPDLRVAFNYRQLSKYTEEPHTGADGGFLVRVTSPHVSVTSPHGIIKKTALFQAKLLKGEEAVRDLSMHAKEAKKFKQQATDMLAHTDEAIAIFYTHTNIYVVDAKHYRSSPADAIRHPLSEDHRLVTLGTYLGRWLPRCTKGDRNPDLISRVEHQDGFKERLTMDVITTRPSIHWNDDDDPAEHRWRGR